jgi:hypothetical protein
MQIRNEQCSSIQLYMSGWCTMGDGIWFVRKHPTVLDVEASIVDGRETEARRVPHLGLLVEHGADDSTCLCVVII